MIDSGSKHPENRIHLFDPVALINDGYGAARYKSSTNNNNNVAVKPNRPTKSYGNNFEEEVHTNGGLLSYDHVATLTSTDRISSDSFSMETNGVQLSSQNDSPNPEHDYSHGGGLGLTFGVDKSNGLEGDSDDSTPRLWKPLNNSSSSHPTTPKSKNSSPFDHVSSSTTMSLSQPSSPSNKHGYHQSMSPNSRTQAIAKGRRELMDMVKDLPESFYELSLRDIVEQKAEFGVQKGVIVIPEEQKTTLPSEMGKTELEKKEKEKERKSGKKVKKSESKKKMVRSRSIDNGRFLLRTSVFPIFPGSRKSKKNLGGSTSFKVAPMGKGEPGSSGVVKGSGDKDWWRRKSCISSESGESNVFSSKDTSSSGSSGSSSLSSSINGRHSNRFLPICCLFNGRKIASKK